MAELRFPVRDPDDELAVNLHDVVRGAVANGQLTDTEAPVVREIGRRLILDGVQTFGEVLERLEGLGAAGQRQWLDEAHIARGMSSPTEVEQRRADFVFEGALARTWPPPPPSWDEMQVCPAQGCNARPTKDGGAWAPTDRVRWHCPAHEGLAAEGDMEPYEPPYTGFFTANGVPIPSEREKARIARWHEERQAEEERERELREEHDRREAEALAKVEERYDRDALISVGGIQVHPRNLRINP